MAALLTIFLLSLGGFPPTVGFIGKWYIFNAAVQAGFTKLAIIGVLTSVVSVFFYLRVVVMMYMTDDRAPGDRPATPWIVATGLLLALVAVFYLGVQPGQVLSLARQSVSMF
jgi:NADH-quinone oxidoreductase subunit N